LESFEKRKEKLVPSKISRSVLPCKRRSFVNSKAVSSRTASYG